MVVIVGLSPNTYLFPAPMTAGGADMYVEPQYALLPLTKPPNVLPTGEAL